MKVFLGIPKVLALSLLSFLLTLSLFVFGIAFTVERTALNARFVVSEINKIDSDSLVRAVLDQDESDDLPPEVKAAVLDALDRIEPTVKEAIVNIIRPVYAYVLGKGEEFDAVGTLKESVVNPEFFTALLDNLDLNELLSGVDELTLLKELVGEEAFDEMPLDTRYIVPYLGNVVTDLEPWLKEQLPRAVMPAVDYLLRESDSFHVDIPLESAKLIVRDSLIGAFFATPPFDLSGMSRNELENYFSENYAEITAGLPSTFTLDETIFESDPRPGIAESLAEAKDGLGKAREYVSYFKLGFWLLLAFVILLIAFIWLVYRRVKPAGRHVGIIFVTVALPELTGVMIGQGFLRSLILKEPGLPAALQSPIVNLMKDALTPFIVFLIVTLLLGIALIIFSILYKGRTNLQSTGATGENGMNNRVNGAATLPPPAPDAGSP